MAQICKCGHWINSHHMKKIRVKNVIGKEYDTTQTKLVKQSYGECSKCGCKQFSFEEYRLH